MPKDNTNRAGMRNTLLANGYTPLPLAAKGCFITGWSTAEVTEDWLGQYARIAKYPNTGLRCDNLIAFDLDITDIDLCVQAERIVEQQCGHTQYARVGQEPKVLLLYRAIGKGPYRKARTAKYGDHRAELLAGHGVQFAAYGRHPSGSQYTWLGDEDPLSGHIDELPTCNYDLALSVLDELGELLKATGLPEQSPRLQYGLTANTEYDLTDSFECLIDGEVITWGELKQQLDEEGVFGNVRREDGEFGDSSAVHFMLTRGSKQPAVHDFIRDCTHFDTTITPELAEVLPEQPKADIFTPDYVDELLNDWVLVGFDNTVRNVDEPMRAYPLAHFKSMHQHWQIEVPAAGGKTKLIPAVDGWLKSTDAMRTHYAALCPDTDELLVPRGKRTVFNTYYPPDHAMHLNKNSNTKVCDAFLRHLFPKDDERQLFIDWHSLKVAHPSWRMHGMVTVTPGYGTGRGTWYQILAKLFGQDYCARIDLKDLTGTGTQSAYNDYMADSLIVYVPEALEEREDQHRWTSRHIAYENLKNAIELQAGPMRINRKYGRNTTETVYASVLISSNHTDALAIEPGDRRLIVLDNTEEPLPEGHAIHDWLEHPSNIAALHAELLLNASAAAERYKPFAMPPLTPAKERMIESGQSDTDRAFDYMLETAPGDIVTPQQWAAYAHQARIQWQLDLPTAEVLQKALTAVIQKRARRCEGLPGNKLKIEGKSQRPWIIRNFEAWKGAADAAIIRAEIDKNGPAAGNVTPFTSKE